MKLSYTHIQAYERQILTLRAAGKTRQEIADELGCSKEQIKECVKRYNRRERKREVGILPRPKGRPPAGSQTVEERLGRENKQLRMENELLRSFLHHAGRR